MIDRSIEYRNVIMRCDHINKSAYRELDDAFCMERYQYGMEAVWSEVQKLAGEFSEESNEEVMAYFRGRFDKEKLKKRCIFIKDVKTQKYIGTCIAWEERYDDMTIPVLHWLAVSDEYSGKGVARILITIIMKIFDEAGVYPVYLHTQPWSYKAVKLYNDFGFNICKIDSFGETENEYELAMPILKQIMNNNVYNKLEQTSVE